MGAGKSTFLKCLKEKSVQMNEKWDFSTEPVSEWTSLGSGKDDLLESGIHNVFSAAYSEF